MTVLDWIGTNQTEGCKQSTDLFYLNSLIPDSILTAEILILGLSTELNIIGYFVRSSLANKRKSEPRRGNLIEETVRKW